ncbi:hypothetical protein [Lamprobacter modestohalophilus]|uniref:hypothetical protein n=1 Tax=Lamprobacter modestohalophilus TaxID=1064514 RepID=UPI0019083081|nr:hypothetical protein [Lamprobacter modestohalophilus]
MAVGDLEKRACRSPRLSFEMFDKKLAGVIEIRAADMRARTLPFRLRDSFARLLTPYL